MHKDNFLKHSAHIRRNYVQLLRTAISVKLATEMNGRQMAGADLQQIKELHRNLSLLDRSRRFIAKSTPYTEPKSRKPKWERIHNDLMKDKEPYTAKHFHETEVILKIPATADFVEKWNKSLWFGPQLLAKELNEICPGRTHAEVSFEKDGVLALSINVHDENDEPYFHSNVKIHIAEGFVEDKKYFLYDENKRGKGMVRPVLFRLHKLYKNLGIRQIRTSAELETGAYVWARAGYLPNQTEWNKLSKTISNKLLTYKDTLLNEIQIQPNTFEQLMKLAGSSDPKQIWFFADLDFQLNGEKFGYLLLAGEQWKGYLNLDDKEQRKRFRLFIGSAPINVNRPEPKKPSSSAQTGLGCGLIT